MTTRQSQLDRRPWMVAAVLFALSVATLLSGLSRFGIWDPWELHVADSARDLVSGRGVPFSEARRALLASLGFRLFGVREWAGRLPGALCGMGCVLVAYAMGRKFVDARMGLVAGLVTLSSPLFVLNVLPMGGHALGFLFQGVTAWAGAATMFAASTARARVLLAISTLSSAWAATMVYGMLVGGLPPLLALGAVAWLTLRGDAPTSAWVIRVVWIASAAVSVAMVTWSIIADVDHFSLWTGGQPASVVPTGFDHALERIFHSFAPWSALLPLALVYPFVTADDAAHQSQDPQSTAAPIGILCTLWCASGYAAQTLFQARFSQDAVFLPVIAAGLLVAFLLRAMANGRVPGRFAGIVVVLLSGLLLRDYALYPESALEGLAMHNVSVPKVFNPKVAWAVLLGLFAATIALPFATLEPIPWRGVFVAPYRLIAAQFRRGTAFRVWLGVIAAGLVGLLALSILAWTMPQRLGLTTLGARIARGGIFALLVLPLAVGASQALYVACSHLGRFRLAPVLFLGVASAFYVSHAFLPALSGHLSPRDVYESFTRLAGHDAILAEFKVGGGAAEYYVANKVKSIASVGELLTYLDEDDRRWAAVPSSEFALVDSRFRRQHARHLFVADAENSHVLLVTNQPLAGRRDQSPLAGVISSKPPRDIDHPITATFDGKIQLLGYDLASRRPGLIGSGESITLTWYYQVLKRVGTNYKLFVHIDGSGTRIHGDHDPVDGKYPTSLWEVGDVIADRHVVEIPASTRVGIYDMLMGFYKNERRMTVEDGPHDDTNRVRAGALRIR